MVTQHMTEEERAESWLMFNLRLVRVDNDILRVGKVEDHRAKVAEHAYGRDAPDWLRGRATWRDMRGIADLSREELAEQLGIDRASISRYESGARFPDRGGPYARWLKTAYDKYLADAEEDVVQGLLIRDGWMVPDLDRGENYVKWAVDLTGDQLAGVLARLDELVVQPWIAAGHPHKLEGHYTPSDFGSAA
jgi:DNA-binding XRE family transcriptional regulator